MSITVPMPGKDIPTLPPEVVKALKIKPSSSLLFEIEEGGRVILKKVPAKKKQPKPGKIVTFADLAGTFPKMKPGVKTASIEEIDDIIKARAVARYERSLQ